MKKMFLMIIAIMAGISFSCQKDNEVELTTLSLKLKSGLQDNMVENGMNTLFQATATNYSMNYPFLWIIDGDSLYSDQLTQQRIFEETGQKNISLTVYDSNGYPTTAEISIIVIEEYPYPTEFQLYGSAMMSNGEWLYAISTNLDYIEGSPEKYYWFEKDQNGEWISDEIINIYTDENGVKWGSFSVMGYNMQKIWSYGKMEDGVIIQANITGSNHYDPEEGALHTVFYNGNLANLPFIFPSIPGNGDDVYSVEKSNTQITLYFNFEDYSNYQSCPICEIKTNSGTQTRVMSHYNGTGWSSVLISEEDIVDNLAIFRFGNIDDDGNFHLANNSQANAWNESQGFIILKILDI